MNRGDDPYAIHVQCRSRIVTLYLEGDHRNDPNVSVRVEFLGRNAVPLRPGSKNIPLTRTEATDLAAIRTYVTTEFPIQMRGVLLPKILRALRRLTF